MKIINKLWIGVGVLVVLAPLGLILPEYFKSNGAWGEKRILDLWPAPISDYAFKGPCEKGLLVLSFEYIISAIIGIFAAVCAVLLIGKFLIKKK